MEKVFLKRTSRILSGHLWIFSNELSVSPKKFAAGSLVEVYDNKNKFIGIGYINPDSLISIRLLTRKMENIDADFLHRRITNALNYRKKFLSDYRSCRVIYSEGDFIPGLIVDKYADCIVVQFLTLGIDKMSDMILNLLDKILSPSVIILRNDTQSRILEGLPLEKKIVKGSLDSLPLINEGSITLEVNPLLGQKTGFFLDQRENRIALSRFVRGGRGLDLFCYSGAWALQLAKNGAFVKCIDDSESAIALAKKNFQLNNLLSNSDFIKDDVFEFLRSELKTGNLYDFIVLDPPAFVKSRAKIKEALRGYREINAMAMRLLKSGGILATSSCSYHIERAMFLDALRAAARDSTRTVRLLEYRSQGYDHPVLLSVPETEYLKCAFLEIS